MSALRLLRGPASPAMAVGFLLASATTARAGGSSGGGEPVPSRADVETALRKAPQAGDAELSRLAARADAVLKAITEDRGADEALRARAVAALAYSSGARSHAFLENLIIGRAPSSSAVDRLLVRRAAVALGWRAGPRVVETVAPLLDHADPEVRLDAAVALGLCRAREAEKPLRARLAEEKDPSVRRQIEAALTVVAPPPPAHQPPH
jgi:HEAT repeat protein